MNAILLDSMRVSQLKAQEAAEMSRKAIIANEEARLAKEASMEARLEIEAEISPKKERADATRQAKNVYRTRALLALTWMQLQRSGTHHGLRSVYRASPESGGKRTVSVKSTQANPRRQRAMQTIAPWEHFFVIPSMGILQLGA